MKRPAPKPRNPIARQLRTPHFRKRVVRSRKTYRRKGRRTADDDGSPDDRGCSSNPRFAPLRAAGRRRLRRPFERPSGVADGHT